MDSLEYVMAVIAVMTAVAVFDLARRLSNRIEESAKRAKFLRFEVDKLREELSNYQEILKKKDEEILRLKSELEEKESQISELKERLKFAEKVSQRDIELLRSRMEQLRAITDEIMHKVTELYNQLEKEILERRKRE